MAYLFSNSTQYISHNNAVNATVPMTYAAIIKMKSGTNGSPIYPRLFGQYQNSNPNNKIEFFVNTTGTASKPGVSLANAGADGFVFSPDDAGRAVDVFISAVFASATSRKIYVSGTDKATSTTNVSTPFVDRLYIGAANPAFNIFSEATLSECAIWSADLTAAEVSSLAKGFKPTRIRPQSLVFYAPLLRNIQDLRAGLALTNNNSATVADHPRVY